MSRCGQTRVRTRHASNDCKASINASEGGDGLVA